MRGRDAETGIIKKNKKSSCTANSPVVQVSILDVVPMSRNEVTTSILSYDVCVTECISSHHIHHLTKREFGMWEKSLKNSNAFSVILDTDDADKLRSICKATGMTQTAIIRYAVHNYLPHMERIAEGLVTAAENDTAVRHAQ